MRRFSFFRRPRLVRFLVPAVALVLLFSTVQAYTIVLRGGKVLEIPNTFTVTARTLTFEVSPGFQLTLQLSAIDIPATDKANREPPGSFANRLKSNTAQFVQGADSVKGSQQERTITNRELESFASKRREAEVAYERRRRELGLPSLEESRRQALVEADLLRQRFELNQTEEKVREAYWRERAIALKSDMAATDAEMNSIRQQLDWLPSPNAIVTGVPFLGFGRSVVNPTLLAPHVPRVFVTPQIGPQVGRVGFGPVKPGHPASHGVFPVTRGRHRGFAQPFGFPGFAAIASQPFDLSYERTILVSRLNELAARRAGLAARWRALEEEARRAGALPGWLRP